MFLIYLNIFQFLFLKTIFYSLTPLGLGTPILIIFYTTS